MNKFKKYISSTLLFIAIAAVIPAYSIEENSQIQDGEQQQVEIVAPTTWYKQPKVRYCCALAIYTAGLLAAYAGAIYMDKVASPVQLWKMLSDALPNPPLSAFERWVQKEDENFLRQIAHKNILDKYNRDVDLARAFGDSYDSEKMTNDFFNAYREEAKKHGEKIRNIALGKPIDGKSNLYVTKYI